MPLLDKLNPQQREAVETVEGPLLVIAGAGSGKTRVITFRAVHLIDNIGVRPEQILAVTFTNKAAEEMKSRVNGLLAGKLRTGSPLICTFHSLCVRILRRNIERLEEGYTRTFTIYDEDDQSRLVRAAMKDLGVEDKSLNARQALGSISWAKNHGVSPAAYEKQADYATERTERVAQIYKLYQERLRKANALDFDDLLIKAVELLRRVSEVRGYYHERFRHVMIDEFQDTNGIQYELARLIVVPSRKPGEKAAGGDELWKDRSLCVVGDVDQSIYSWRGSDFNIILGFKNDFEGTKTIKLEQNYRSTHTILDAANALIERNRLRVPKTLRPSVDLGRGDKIGYYQSYDAEGEAAFVADKVQEHLRESLGTRCVVLYRTNAQSRLFEEAMRRRGIPYNIVGGFSFYERAEVKDIIAYLKLALNPDDDMALARVINSPPRGIGKATLDAIYVRQQEGSMWKTIGRVVEERALGPRANSALEAFRHIVTELGQLVASGESLSEIVKAATLETGYVRSLQEEKTEEAEGRLLNIEELVNAAVEAEEQGESLLDFIDHAALVSDTDQYREDARVTLMTMHSAKGLEFPVVCIVGLEEGLFPHSRSDNSEEELEEERRLCYVAITRAEKHLYITHAMRRRLFGEEMPAEPSRFLNEIPLELTQNLSPGPSWLGFAEQPAARNSSYAATARGSDARRAVKKTSNYTGKTYNSADSVREFFRKRTGGAADEESRSKGESELVGTESTASSAAEFRVGLRVRHARYGQGVVLKLEGSGEDAKLTVSFPGYGQKKFVARYAALEKA